MRVCTAPTPSFSPFQLFVFMFCLFCCTPASVKACVVRGRVRVVPAAHRDTLVLRNDIWGRQHVREVTVRKMENSKSPNHKGEGEKKK